MEFLDTYRPVHPHEIFLGMIYGAGAEMEPFHRLLRESLRSFGYQLRTVHLSDYFPLMLGRDFDREVPDATRQLQDMGDELRRRSGQTDVLARLAAFLIAGKRAAAGENGARTAWLIRSLKRKEEVELLRQLYGPRFILLALYVPEPVRRRNLQNRWERWANVTSGSFEAEAAADIRRDEMDRRVAHGQAVRDTFSLADFFVDGRSDSSLLDAVPRIVRLMFGEPFVPPVREEQAMYHAFTAGLRSAEMGRQVGAALTTAKGDVVAVGANDVPSGSGGLYWSPDEPDYRDFARQPPIDSNTLWQRRIARELLVKMAHSGWVNKSRITKLEDKELDVNETQLDQFLRDVDGTRFSSITEFGRSVHAEMDAITTAARLGISTKGTTLACTTFPCHNCARHIITSGIERVLYIHPYAKSLARDLHDDAIVVEPVEPGAIEGKVVFEQYVGVAPRVYPQYFDFGQTNRKDLRGRAMELPDPDQAMPRVLQSGGTFTFGGPGLPASRSSELERDLSEQFHQHITAIDGVQLPTPSDKEDE